MVIGFVSSAPIITTPFVIIVRSLLFRQQMSLPRQKIKLKNDECYRQGKLRRTFLSQRLISNSPTFQRLTGSLEIIQSQPENKLHREDYVPHR